MLTSTPSSQPAISQRRIVIGDVHGHYDTLNLLLEAIAPNSEDQVYFLGDLIDRGPKSSQVVVSSQKARGHSLRKLRPNIEKYFRREDTGFQWLYWQ